jgi:hypothetical protein
MSLQDLTLHRLHGHLRLTPRASEHRSLRSRLAAFGVSLISKTLEHHENAHPIFISRGQAHCHFGTFLSFSFFLSHKPLPVYLIASNCTFP